MYNQIRALQINTTINKWFNIFVLNKLMSVEAYHVKYVSYEDLSAGHVVETLRDNKYVVSRGGGKPTVVRNENFLNLLRALIESDLGKVPYNCVPISIGGVASHQLSSIPIERRFLSPAGSVIEVRCVIDEKVFVVHCLSKFVVQNIDSHNNFLRYNAYTSKFDAYEDGWSFDGHSTLRAVDSFLIKKYTDIVYKYVSFTVLKEVYMIP